MARNTFMTRTWWTRKKIIFVSLQIVVIALIAWLQMPEQEIPDFKTSFSPRKKAALFSLALDERDFADYTDEIHKYTQQRSEIARDLNFKELTDILFDDLEYIDKAEDGKWAPQFKTPKMSDGSDAKQRATVDDHESAPFGKGTTMNIVKAEFEVTQAHIDQLPAKMRVGLFAKPRVYPATLRVSHALAPDEDYMRLAVRLDTAEDPAAKEKSVSFLTMESTPIFLMRDMRGVTALFHLTHTKASIFSKLWTFLTSFSEIIKIKKNNDLVSENIHDLVTNTSILAKDYYSCMPYALGENNIFKFKFASNLQVDNPIEREGHLDLEANKLLSKQMFDMLSKQAASFDFQIQIATDKSKHDANCASCYWGKQGVDAVDAAENGHYRGGYITMGKLRIPQQNLVPVEEEIAHVSPELAEKLPNSKVLYFNSGESPFPPMGDIQVFRAWMYSRYNPKFMEYVLGKETEEFEDPYFDKQIVGEDRWSPIRGGASTCPFSKIMNSL